MFRQVTNGKKRNHHLPITNNFQENFPDLAQSQGKISALRVNTVTPQFHNIYQGTQLNKDGHSFSVSV